MSLFFIGHVEHISGVCTLTRSDDDPVLIEAGAPVCQGDIIETTAGGKVGIRFADGTALNLSDNARVALTQFKREGLSPSALLDVSRGTFAIIAGEIAKAGRLEIQTPFGKIRGRTCAGGIGMLSMASLFFAAMEEAQASISDTFFIDHEFIDYKDLHDYSDASWGRFILTIPATAASPERTIVVDDPAETIVLRRVGSSISESHVTNTVAQMLQYQGEQQDVLRIFALGQGPTITGPGGSGGLPPPPPSSFVQPINFTTPGQDLPPTFPVIGGPNGSSTLPEVLPTAPPPPPPGPASGAAGELPNVTGNTDNDTATGTLAFSAVEAGPPNFVWSAGPLTSNQTSALTSASSLTFTGADSTGFLFSIQDQALDFLSESETLTITYDVTLTDNAGNTLTQPVVITATGTNDEPMITAANNSGAVGEDNSNPSVTATGTISFADVDLTNSHTVSVSGNATGYLGTLSAIVSDDSTGDATGQVSWTFSVDNAALQFLADGQELTQTYTVSIADGHGGMVNQLVTVTITGTNDEPTITVASTDALGAVSEDNDTPTLSDAGTIAFNDVDLIDVHSKSVTPDEGNTLGGTLTLGAVSEDAATEPGTVGWTYEVTNSATQYLAAGETVQEKFTVTIDDGHGGSVDQVVTVTITGTNDEPTVTVASTDALGAVSEDDNTPTLSDAGTIAFNDVDLIDVHSASVTPDEDNALGGTLTLGTVSEDAATEPGTVAWTYEVANSATQYLAAGETVEEKFTVTIADGHGGSVDQFVTVTITGTEDAPDISIVGTDSAGKTLNEVNAPLSTSGTLTVTDVDLSDTVTASVVTGVTLGGTTGGLTSADVQNMLSVTSGPIAANPTDAHNLIWTFNSNPQVFNFLGAGQSLTLTYTVRATDNSSGGPLHDDQTVTITITGSNDGPVAVADSNGGDAVTEAGVSPGNTPFAGDPSASGNVLTNDTDIDDGDSKSVSAVNGAAANVGASIGGTYGHLTLAANGDWTYTLDNDDTDTQKLTQGQVVKDIFTYTVVDSQGGTSSTTLTINITGTNDQPVAVADSNGADAVTEAGVNPGNTPFAGDPSASGNVLSNDTDVDAPDTKAVVAVNGTDANVGVSISGTYGHLTLTANGDWTYTLDNDDTDTQKLTQGQVVHDIFAYTMVDSNGATSTSSLNITITGTNDAPVVTLIDPATANVSEEGLANGLPDLTPASDTTDSVTANGTINATDPEGANLTYTLGTPVGTVKSGGTTITWSLDATHHTLTGMAGPTTVITIKVDDGTGEYHVTLFRPIDHPDNSGEDVLTINVPVIVSDGPASAQTVLPVKIEDDSPHAAPISASLAIGEGVPKLNIVIILDVSGSMDGSRLVLAKQALDNLLTSTDVNINQVMVVSFSSNATVNAPTGNPWTDAATAKAYIDALSANGSTNYDAAIGAVMNNWGDGPTSADQTLIYFVSDGEPSSGQGLGPADKTNWENFLIAKDVDVSYAIGISTSVGDADLAPIAWTPADPDFPPIVISSASGLDATLQSTIPPPVTHNVLIDGGSGFGFGADGGFIKSIQIDGVTYTFNGVNVITESVSPSPPAGYQDHGSWVVVPTALGGTFTFYFAAANGHQAGDWTYVPPKVASGSGAEAEDFLYTLADRDGDTSSAHIHIDLHVPPQVSNLQITETGISFNVADQDSTDFTLAPPFATAFGNPSLHLGANSLPIPAAGASAVSAILQVTDGNTSPLNVAGLYLGTNGNDTTTAPAFSIPNAIYGFGGNDKLVGGAAADFLFGGTGNDVLIGRAGNDTLTGGADADQFRLATNSGTDTITDYLQGTDKIGFLDTGVNDGGSVNFANTNETAAGTPLNSGDFLVRNSVSSITNDDDNHVIRIDTAQSNSDIKNTTIGGSGSPLNNYILVFNSSSGHGEIWFDSNWENTSGRVQIATLTNVTTLAALKAITESDIIVYSTVADPIILDLGDPGFSFSSLENGVTFEINGDGAADQVAWTASNDGILAYDLNSSGTIENGTELFTPNFAGGNFSSGLTALASLDSNGDGIIDSADAAFGGLLVWQDNDHDGVADDGELSTLSAQGITAINLDAASTDATIDGQQLQAQGLFTYAGGSTGSFVEVAFDTSYGSVSEEPATSEFTTSTETNVTILGTTDADIIAAAPGATLAGDAGNDTFVFKAITDSQPGAGNFDTITDFTHNVDHIDLTAIAGANLVQGLVDTASTVDAHSISWFVDNLSNQTIVYVNTTGTANHVDMEIHLAGTNINLSGADILHHS
ncbi:MAG TPA: VCBS domain-containing protein [Pseudolabrys sp.]|nr:VCBS domain-containing protein [Pseudolabrys sp.]